MDKELLMSYGIDGEKGLKNCMGNLPFYRKILSMFLEDQCFPKAEAAYQSGNRKELFSRMHELKGISGNAALVELYEATAPLVELLRTGSDGAPEAEVERMFAAAGKAYGRACEGIRLYLMNA